MSRHTRWDSYETADGAQDDGRTGAVSQRQELCGQDAVLRTVAEFRDACVINSDPIAEEICVICQETINADSTPPILRTPCRHIFHKSCVEDLISASQDKCPVCREIWFTLDPVAAERQWRQLQDLSASMWEESARIQSVDWDLTEEEEAIVRRDRDYFYDEFLRQIDDKFMLTSTGSRRCVLRFLKMDEPPVLRPEDFISAEHQLYGDQELIRVILHRLRGLVRNRGTNNEFDRFVTELAGRADNRENITHASTLSEILDRERDEDYGSYHVGDDSQPVRFSRDASVEEVSTQSGRSLPTPDVPSGQTRVPTRRRYVHSTYPYFESGLERRAQAAGPGRRTQTLNHLVVQGRERRAHAASSSRERIDMRREQLRRRSITPDQSEILSDQAGRSQYAASSSNYPPTSPTYTPTSPAHVSRPLYDSSTSPLYDQNPSRNQPDAYYYSPTSPASNQPVSHYYSPASPTSVPHPSTRTSNTLDYSPTSSAHNSASTSHISYRLDYSPTSPRYNPAPPVHASNTLDYAPTEYSFHASLFRPTSPASYASPLSEDVAWVPNYEYNRVVMYPMVLPEVPLDRIPSPVPAGPSPAPQQTEATPSRTLDWREGYMDGLKAGNPNLVIVSEMTEVESVRQVDGKFLVTLEGGREGPRVHLAESYTLRDGWAVFWKVFA